MSSLRLAALVRVRGRIPAAVAGPILLGLGLWLAFALRLYRLDAQAIWWDESLSLYRATRDLATILANTITFQNTVTYDTLPPLYFVLLHGAVALFGTSEFALRFLSLAVNVATIPLLYVTARRWFSRDVALVAALLAALSPFYVSYSQEARPYTLVLFETLLAVYALTRAFPVSSRHPSTQLSNYTTIQLPTSNLQLPAFLILYFAATAASLYTHYHAIFLIPFHVVLIAVIIWPLRGSRKWLALGLPALPVAAAVFTIPLIRASMAGNVGGGPANVPLFIILRDLLNSFSVGITANLDQFIWIDLALLLLFLIGLFSSLSFRPATHTTLKPATWKLETFIPLVSFIVIPLLGLQIASTIRPLYLQSRYFITLSPPFYIGLAVGIVALGRRARLLAIPAIAVFLVGATFSLANLYWDPQYAKDDNRAWAGYLHEHVRPGDYLILDSPHTEALYEYYAGQVVPWASLPMLHNGVADAPDADAAAVKIALSRSVRVWFLQMQVPFDDPAGRIEKILDEQGLLVDRVNFAGTSTAISLSLYLPALPVASTASVAHPLNLTIGSGLRLIGYDAPAAVESGGRATVKLYWALDQRVGEDLSVSLRLRQPPAGEPVPGNQYDAVLVGSRAGTSTWPAGQTVEDTHEFPVDAGTRPGRYQLQAQVYRAVTGQSVGDTVTLGEIEVRRPAVPLAPESLPITHLDASLGAFRLIGGDWPSGATRPGDILPVAVYFQVESKSAADLTLDLELARRLFPIVGSLTTSIRVPVTVTARDLEVGDIVRQDVSLRVPADAVGDHELQLVTAGALIPLGTVNVQPLARVTGLPPISHPLSARAGEAIEFLGYDLNTSEARAGGTLSLTLYWRAQKGMDTSYTVFTHVIDTNNQIWGQKDNVPGATARPTTGWVPGEVIVDPYAIVLSDTTPPGKYAIEIGLYESTSGARLATFDGSGKPLGDRILLPGIEVR